MQNKNNNTVKYRRYGRAGGALLVAFVLPAQAANVYWSDGDCSSSQYIDWTSNCWTAMPGGAASNTLQPQNGDDVFLRDQGSSSGVNVQYSFASGDPFSISLNSFSVDSTSPSGFFTIFDQPTNVFTTINEVVGDAGRASVQVEGGRAYAGASPVHRVSDTLTVGNAAGSDGSYSVRSGGSLSVGNFLTLGRQGTAQMLVVGDDTAGAVVSAGVANLGKDSGSRGELVVAGSGGSFTSRALIVGDAGTGLLEIGYGASVTVNGGVSIGAGAGGNGDVRFSTGGGSFTSDGLEVGREGTGSLSISEGTVSSGQVSIGVFTGGRGTVDVSSGGTLLGSYLSVGAKGTGALSVAGAGAVAINNSMFVGQGGGGSGQVTVGAGSLSAAQIYLGGDPLAAGGSGTLTVNPGGNVASGSTLKIWSGGRLNLAGGTLTTSVFDNAGTFNFTDGLLQVSNGSFSTAGSTFSLSGATAGDTPTLALDNSSAASGTINVGLRNQGHLRLTSGATLSDTSGFIGRGSSAAGTATVDGTGSHWSNSSSLFVGNLGNGGLTISNGGQVTSANGYVASGTAASGNVAVTGAGSLWDNSSTLYVGHGGSATLNLSDAAQMNSRSAFVGNQSTGVGSITLDNARWDNSGTLYLGYNGNASLQALNGGVVTGSTTYLGRFAGSSGALNVSGAGSQVAVGNNLYIGYEGDGTARIDNGGSVDASDAFLAHKPGATADVSLSGGTLNASGGLSVGGGSSSAGGTATLAVNDGATATVGGRLKIWNGGTLNLAGGTVTTRVFDNGGVFNFSNGLLQVSNGSFNTPGSTLIVDGAASGDTPTLSLDNSTASLTGTAYVGFDRQANLNLRNGATLNSASGFVALSNGATGTVSVDGAGSSWSMSGNLFVGRSGNGTLNILNGGGVSATETTLGRLAGSTGTLTLSGAGSNLNTGNLSVGREGFGSFTIDGGNLSTDVVSLGHDAGAWGELSVYSGTLNSGTDLYIGGSAAGTGGTGRLTLSGGDATVGGLTKLYTDGRLVIDGGTLTTGSFDSGGGTVKLYNGLLAVNNGSFNAGSLQLNPRGGNTLAATLALRGATGTASDLTLFGLSNVDITNGAGLTSGFASIGQVATLVVPTRTLYLSADARVSVDGIGSSWDSGTLYVGRRTTPPSAADTLSSGRLDVTNGASVSSGDVYLGDGNKTQGTALVDNAAWTTGDIRLGATSGSADVQVSNGGLVRSTNIFSTPTSASTLSVSGPASRWINSGVLSLTRDALNIAGGARVSSPTSYLGRDVTASVDGSGSLFSSDNTYVGGNAASAGGSASLAVRNGGEADIAHTLKIWDAGEVTLSGGTLRAETVGNAGKLRLYNGNLLVANGSFASGGGTTSGGVFDAANSALVIAGLVRGNNPTLVLTNTTATINGDLYAGTSGGTGRIVARSGSSLSGNLVNLGYDAGSIGTLSLSGLTTTASSSGWTVGDAGTGSLSASNGATVNADGDTTIGNAASGLGLISLSGSGTRLTTNGYDLYVGRAGSGELSIRSGARVTGNAAQIGGADGNGTGTARVEGVGSTWVGGALDINNGALTVTAGAQVRPATLSVARARNSTGTVTVSGTGSGLTTIRSMVLGEGAGARATLGIDNAATVTIGDSLRQGEGNATVTLTDGALTVSNDTDVGQFTLSGGRLRTGTLRTAGNRFDFTGGTLSADTVIGDLINQGGDLAPGNSPGATAVSGDYTQSPAGIFSVEIGGRQAGSEYDVLNVSGQANLAGVLRVDWYDSGSGMFSAAAGDSFDVLSANILSGQFDALDLAPLSSGLAWQGNYLIDVFGSTDVLRLSVVSAVPVPAAVWLFASGVIGLVAVARRRRGA